MAVTWVVYIDESGDEGFVFSRGSSQWFILSAVITAKENDLATVKLIDHVRKIIFERKDTEPLHFRKMKHEHRIPFLHHIADANLSAIVLMVYKPCIESPEEFRTGNALYFYCSKLLLEQVSLYCQEQKANSVIKGDGSAEVVFSNRGGMKYEEFRQYLEQLKNHFLPNTNSMIDWSIIQPDQIQAASSKLMGLQIADAVASRFFMGTQLNQYGYNEPRYVKIIKPIIYNSSGIYYQRGIAIFPDCMDDIKTQSHLEWLRGVYDFPV